MPGTPHAPMISQILPSKSVGINANYMLTSFLHRLSFDVEKLLFSTLRTHTVRSDRMSGDNPHFYFHFMAKTLLEDEAGQSFADADAALRHAKTLAAQLSEGGHLVGCTILVTEDQDVLFEVPLAGWKN